MLVSSVARVIVAVPPIVPDAEFVPVNETPAAVVAGMKRSTTATVAAVVERSGILTGLCTVFVRHTSASLVIQENADPAVHEDLRAFLDGLAPEDRRYRHADEGPDDMPAHARAALTHTSESLPVVKGELGLGTWQALYVFEHRHRNHERELVVTITGE